jgi:hypothetical protein
LVDWLFSLVLGQAVLVGSVLVLLGLFGVKPIGYLVLLLGTVEVSLLVQLAVSVGMALAGQAAAISTIEFFGYLLVALLVPVAGALWGLAEKSRWSTVILGASSLTVGVMLVRMWQIWYGAYPF